MHRDGCQNTGILTLGFVTPEAGAVALRFFIRERDRHGIGRVRRGGGRPSVQTSLKYPSLSRARHKATQRSVRLAQIVVVALCGLHRCGAALLVRFSAHRGFALPLKPRHLGTQMNFGWKSAPCGCENFAPYVTARCCSHAHASFVPRSSLSATLAPGRPAASSDVFSSLGRFCGSLESFSVYRDMLCGVGRCSWASVVVASAFEGIPDIFANVRA